MQLLAQAAAAHGINTFRLPDTDAIVFEAPDGLPESVYQ